MTRGSSRRLERSKSWVAISELPHDDEERGHADLRERVVAFGAAPDPVREDRELDGRECHYDPPGGDVSLGIDEREPRYGGDARDEERAEREEDARVGVGQLAAEQRDDGHQGGGDEKRRRPQPERPGEPAAGHALAAAFVFFGTALRTMKRSMSSRASSSRICFGGDFMR